MFEPAKVSPIRLTEDVRVFLEARRLGIVLGPCDLAFPPGTLRCNRIVDPGDGTYRFEFTYDPSGNFVEGAPPTMLDELARACLCCEAQHARGGQFAADLETLDAAEPRS